MQSVLDKYILWFNNKIKSQQQTNWWIHMSKCDCKLYSRATQRWCSISFTHGMWDVFNTISTNVNLNDDRKSHPIFEEAILAISFLHLNHPFLLPSLLSLSHTLDLLKHNLTKNRLPFIIHIHYHENKLPTISFTFQIYTYLHIFIVFDFMLLNDVSLIFYFLLFFSSNHSPFLINAHSFDLILFFALCMWWCALKVTLYTIQFPRLHLILFMNSIIFKKNKKNIRMEENRTTKWSRKYI